ncbi:MAG: HipA domain-containing protein [bacterium]|nr:HipA domain-containing protein [bacterium]
MTTEDISDHRHRYDELDVSEWVLAAEEPLGTKPKQWLIHPDTGHRWLMKDATFNTPSGGPKYRKGDDWAERVAYGVAEALCLPAARVELSVAFRGEGRAYGTICRSVLKDRGEHLVHGNALLAEALHAEGIHVTGDDRESYTVTAIHRVLGDCQPPTDASDDLSAWDVFVGYLALDALIGNTDRHNRNWAVIESGSGRCLAPSFDHASSLGFLLSDAERQERLSSKDHNRTPEAYADRARTRFAGKPHPIAALDNARALDGETAVTHWLNQPKGIEDLVAPIWAIPEDRMSEPAREFAERIMRRNWARLTGPDRR